MIPAYKITTALTPPMAQNDTFLCVVMRLAAPVIYAAEILNLTAARVTKSATSFNADYENDHGLPVQRPYASLTNPSHSRSNCQALFPHHSGPGLLSPRSSTGSGNMLYTVAVKRLFLKN